MLFLVLIRINHRRNQVDLEYAGDHIMTSYYKYVCLSLCGAGDMLIADCKRNNYPSRAFLLVQRSPELTKINYQ